MPKITKRLVENLKPSDRDVVQWDTELRGFGVRVKPSGVRSYMIQYRNRYGRSRRYTIGMHGRLTAEEARQEARQLLAEVARGGDPASARVAAQKHYLWHPELNNIFLQLIWLTLTLLASLLVAALLTPVSRETLKRFIAVKA